MKVTRESVTPTEVTLNIVMDSEDEDPFVNRSYRRTVGRLQIPGFRKGKAPRSIVESYVGRTALVQEALEFMIPETLDKVLKEEDVQAFIEPQIEVTEIEPVSFTAVVPLEPQVDLGEFRSIRLQKEVPEIDDERVAEVLEQLRQESAPWEPAERPVNFGDLLNLNVLGTIDDEQVVDDQAVDYVPQAENVLPFPGFAVYLEGMAEDEEKEFTLTIPEDYPRPQYAGKECHFYVQVLSIKEKRLPDLDDEFAKGVGEGYDDLEALRQHLRQRLEEEAEAEANRRLEQESLEELVKVATVRASDMLYQREVDRMQQDRERSLQNQRIPMETYLGYLGQTAEEFREQLRPMAEDRLTRYLVLRKLAEEENVEVSSEEVEEEIDSLVSSAGDSEEAMRRALSSESAKENVQSSLTDRKVIQRLVQIFQGEEGGSEGESQETPESEQPPASEPDREPPDQDAPEPNVPVADVEPLDSTHAGETT
ncbi:MAG: trigger factor [Chloroflexi bacterium]|nr:trigger factor [Chloroflexota bacterium]